MRLFQSERGFINVLMIVALVLLIAMGGLYVYAATLTPEEPESPAQADAKKLQDRSTETIRHPSRYRLKNPQLTIEAGPATSVLSGIHNWQLFSVLQSNVMTLKGPLRDFLRRASKLEALLRPTSTYRFEKSAEQTVIVLPLRTDLRLNLFRKRMEKLAGSNRKLKRQDELMKFACIQQPNCTDYYARRDHNNLVLATGPEKLNSIIDRSASRKNKSLFGGPPDSWAVRLQARPGSYVPFLSAGAQTVELMARLENGTLEIQGDANLRELLKPLNGSVQAEPMVAPDHLPSRTVAYGGLQLPDTTDRDGSLHAVLRKAGLKGELGAALHLKSKLVREVLLGQQPFDKLADAAGLTLTAQYDSRPVLVNKLRQWSGNQSDWTFKRNPDRLVLTGMPGDDIDDVTFFLRTRSDWAVLTTEETPPPEPLSDSPSFQTATRDYPDKLHGLFFMDLRPVGRSFPEAWPDPGPFGEEALVQPLSLIEPGTVRAVLTELRPDVMAYKLQTGDRLQVRSSINGPIPLTVGVGALYQDLTASSIPEPFTSDGSGGL